MSIKEPLQSGEQEPRSPRPSRRSRPSDRDSHLEALLKDWETRAWAAQIAHYRVASRLRKYNLMLGLPVVIFTTIVGTSLFATLSQDAIDMWLRVTLGCVSVVAAILAGIQTFLNFAKRADQHAVAADWYASIRRKIEQQANTARKGRADSRKFLDRDSEGDEHRWVAVPTEIGQGSVRLRRRSPRSSTCQQPGAGPEAIADPAASYRPKHAGQ